jgi:NitT/TauT family transport system substrate-binding protein
MPVTRRAIVGAALAGPALPLYATPLPSVRIGVLRYGTLSWETDVIRHHALDVAAHINLVPVELAAAPAAQVALQAGEVGVIVIDWLWVARQRSAGADWTFIPFSNAVGALIAPTTSPILALPDLRERRLGIAGTPLDKSWLILRGYAAKRYDIDLDSIASKTFGPPPLLAEQMKAGRLDALLTYWPFAAKAEAAGARQILAVEDAVAALGINAGVPYIGYVFSQHWAEQNPGLIDGLSPHRARHERSCRHPMRNGNAWPRSPAPATMLNLRDCAIGIDAVFRAGGRHPNAAPPGSCLICSQASAAGIWSAG